MHNPELYASTSVDISGKVNNYLLEKYLPKMKFNKENVSIFEVGTADGYTTIKVLLPKIQKKCKELVGFDISEEMTTYARKKWDRPGVKFVQMDITDENIPEEFHQKFDHGFTFYCLHWITNKRAAYQNMFNLLGPQGNLLGAHVTQSPIFENYVKLAEYPRWRQLIPEDLVSCFMNLPAEVDQTDQMLKEIGFKDYFVTTEDFTYTWSSSDAFRELWTSIDPIISGLPNQEKLEYGDAYMQEIEKLEGIIFAPNGGPVHMNYKLIIVYASKCLAQIGQF